MAFQKAVKGTILVGGGALASVLGLSQFAHYRRKQVNLAYVQAAECVSEPVNREPPSREAQLLSLQNTAEFDILVIGGGATGCGCALDAVTRGLKTALVERDDFSSGTSSRSTKLIHGGVRYLQKAIMKLDIEQYRMVKEALHERANLLEIAPHLSAPLPIMLPVYKWWQLPYYWVGIKLYDLVAGSNCLKSSYVLSKSRALEHFPMLQKDKLVGAIVYYDGQHNDARMNLAIALTAARYGAATANYMEVVSLLKKTDPHTGKERVSGARCKDVLTGQEFDVRAKCVINATGPFTDTVRKMDDKNAAAICQPSAGVHIVMPGYYSPESMGLLDPATSDGRVIFFLPWQKMTIAGTTDTPTDITHHPIPSEEDINFILNEVRNYLSCDVEGNLCIPLSLFSFFSISRPIPALTGNYAETEAPVPILQTQKPRPHDLRLPSPQFVRVGATMRPSQSSCNTCTAKYRTELSLEELETARKFLYYEMGYKSRSEQLTDRSEISLLPSDIDRYKKRFHKFDADQKGFITIVDVQRVLESINVQMDENTLHEILNEVDLNKNGQVELNEFLQLMSAIQKGRVSGSRLAILMKTAEENLDRRVPIPVDRSCGGL
uniref:glycerol-3-phosphate dehydrogenase, mitochondrial n=1 Tax=Panthera onca TaxID=9690 RepID=UPI0029551437|nr:glycerol-3-phosphate dehydrogenase, mitochondrial [Panthera onca]